MKLTSIGFKLITGCCIAIILPLAISTFTAADRSTRSITDQSRKHMVSTAEDIASLVRISTQKNKTIAAAFASDPLVTTVAMTVNQKTLQGAADEIRPLRQSLKKKFKLLGNQYLGIFVTDAKGTLFTGELANGEEYKGSNIASRDYFNQARTTGTPVFGDVVRSKSTGELIAVVCAPIHSQTDEFLGVFGMSMKASALTDLVTGKRIGETGYAFMVNREGVVIAHPDKAHVLSLNLNTQEGTEALAKGLLSGGSGSREYRYDNTPKLAGFAPVTSQGWGICTTQKLSEFKADADRLKTILLYVALASLAVAVTLVFLVSKQITGPINHAVKEIKSIARGDLTKTLEVKSRDEIGELSAAINQMVRNFTRLFREVNNSVLTITQASEDLDKNALDMNKTADFTAARAKNVTQAAEQMSEAVTSVAVASEQSAVNVNHVAAAAEEMNATITEIAQKSALAKDITEKAVDQAVLATDEITSLREAAEKISTVTETITEISDQINLLALNATIEAARAGDAGKGFAVVATEIKALAQQTAEATHDIKNRIEQVQISTRNAATQITDTTSIIRQVNQTMVTIAGAVEEQSIATEEIAKNVSQASQGIQEVNLNISENSASASAITRDISTVTGSMDEMAVTSSQIGQSTGELNKLSTRLKQVTGTYRIADPVFDIAGVKNAHMQWRAKLEGLLQGRQTLGLGEVSDHHQCAFGQWYFGGEGQKLGHLPIFKTVGDHHGKVHAHALEIVRLYNANQREEAESLMVRFEEERDALFSSLDEMYLV